MLVLPRMKFKNKRQRDFLAQLSTQEFGFCDAKDLLALLDSGYKVFLSE